MTIRRAAWWGTLAFVATAVAAVAAPNAPLEIVAFVVAVTLFVVGCGAFFVAYSRAVSRSRTDLIGVTDVFFLPSAVAPPDVRRSLLGALAVQVAVALGSAIARPYSSLAAGALVPVFGLAMCGLWAARHGTFPPRQPDAAKASSKAPSNASPKASSKAPSKAPPKKATGRVTPKSPPAGRGGGGGRKRR